MTDALEYGVVLEVTEATLGDELETDHPAGSTTLALADAVDFNEDGGDLLVGEEVLAYSSADLEEDVVVLASPTGQAYLVGDPVQPWPITRKRVALVDLEDGGDAVSARVPHTLWDRLPEGTRDVDVDPERVSLVMDGSEWVVGDVLAREPWVDGSYIDRDTLPDVTVPTEPPAVSPALTVRGVTNGLVIRSENVDPGTVIAYHITDTPPVDAAGDPLPFTPTADTLIGEPTAATVFVVTELPDGTPLVPDRTYYLRAVASNVIDEAEPGPMTEGMLDLDVVSELFATKIEAGFLLAGTIQVGQITIDATRGIEIPTVGGGITLPADGGQATFTGKVVSGEVQVENHLTINGRDNAINGQLLLANVVTAPTSPPEVGYQFPATATIGADTWSLTDNPTGTEWVSIKWGTDRVERYSKATGQHINSQSLSSTGSTWGPYYLNGIVESGGWYYATADHRGDNLDLYLLKIQPDPLGVWTETRVAATRFVPRAAAVGLDEFGNILVAYARTDGTTIRVNRHNPSTLALVSQDLLDYGGGGAMTTPLDLTGIHRLPTGPGGAVEWWVGLAGGRLLRHSGLSAVEADRATTPESVKGLHWDGTRLWTLGYSSYRVWRWSTNRWDAPVSTTHTWYDSTDAGTGKHETQAGPAVSYQPPPFSYLRVVRPDPPFSGDVDSPDTSRLYLDNHLQAGGEVYQQYTLFEAVDLAGGPAPTVNGFDNAAAYPGSLASSARDSKGPLIELSGNGFARVPGLPPPGSVTMYAGPVDDPAKLPPGWLACKGQALSTALYPALYAAIGFAYGGSGSTFYLPDLRRRFPMGALDDGATGDSRLGASDGTTDPALRSPKHDHPAGELATGGPVGTAGRADGGLNTANPQHTHNITGTTGDALQLSTTNPDRQFPYLSLNFIIKT